MFAYCVQLRTVLIIHLRLVLNVITLQDRLFLAFSNISICNLTLSVRLYNSWLNSMKIQFKI